MTRPIFRIEIYGGEDYRLYEGTRLVATVYAQKDLIWFVPEMPMTLEQRVERLERKLHG